MPLRFTTEIIPIRRPLDRPYQVSFLRQGVITCRTASEAEAMTAAHLARADQHGVIDQVIAAVRLVPAKARHRQDGVACSA